MWKQPSRPSHEYGADGWDKFSHPYSKKEFGKWELVLPPKPDNSPAVDHNTRLKVVVHTKEGERLYRNSPWAKYVTTEEKSVIYDWVLWDPPQPYVVRLNFLNG
ncbi:hypothetical protein CHARACLAT_027064 [Characodon lateralis]|uniref:Glycoside hydrolase family 13 N-terminal domain-containing protein n=1 Tax=Characodon lateralis TaxID=208331 RepID=A0ABU7CRS1_9TELE|nr:hypothetical protein [Characodon lateralis]